MPKRQRIWGQAKNWANRMKTDGYDVYVPAVRYGKYAFADVTVTAIKGGKTFIRHPIFRG